MFDPEIVEGQIQGGIVMGLAQVVGENLDLAGGVVPADSFLRYLVPTSLDAPDRLGFIFSSPGPAWVPRAPRGSAKSVPSEHLRRWRAR